MLLPASSAFAVKTLTKQQEEEEERIRLKKLVLHAHQTNQISSETTGSPEPVTIQQSYIQPRNHHANLLPGKSKGKQQMVWSSNSAFNQRNT